MRLNGRSAIITGAAQGLGEALAERLAKEGANVLLADINGDGAKAVARRIAQAHDVIAIGHRVDVTREEDAEEVVRLAVEEFGRLDILVANAGILKAHEVTDFPVEEWRKVIDVNLIGYFICARAAAKVMRDQKSGVIVQINSKSGKKGSYRSSAYAASKFGGIGLTQSIALEMAEYGVRINSICPGNLMDSPLWVDSLYSQYAKKWGTSEEEVRRKYLDQVPLKRTCTYDDVCNVLVFLASDASSYMTGQAINVTGGQEMG